MKKLLSILIVVVVLASLVLPEASAVSAGNMVGDVQVPAGSKQVAPFKNDFLAPTAQWKSLVAGDVPAEMYATYALADNVVQVNSSVTKTIATSDQLISGVKPQLTPGQIVAGGGYIPKGVLDAAAAQKSATIQNGSVVVDTSTGTAFKVVSPTSFSGVYAADPDMKSKVQPLENTYSITKPALNEVIKNFNLDQQTVNLTKANVTGFAKNVEGNVVNPSQYKALGGLRRLENAKPARRAQF